MAQRHPRKRRITIYALADPETGSVRYVGITRNKVHTRLYSHFAPSNKNKPVTKWLHQLRQNGLEPDVILLAQLGRPELECEKHSVASDTTWGRVAATMLEEAFASWIETIQDEPLLNVDRSHKRKRNRPATINVL